MMMIVKTKIIIIFFFASSSSFFLMAAPAAYGGSQARGQIGPTAAQPEQHGILAESAVYTTAHGNVRYFTH